MDFGTYPSLKDRTVVVSGGASGIGADIVRGFAAQGSRVGFLDNDAAGGKALAKELGSNVAFSECDLRDIPMLKESIAGLRKSLGPVSVLVNNAARDDRHDWRKVTQEYWDERAATNIRHMFFAIQAAAPDMIETGGGSIVNVGSCSWMMPQGGFPAYATSKAAVHGLTRTMARDLGPHKIRVNTVVPGWIMTQRQKDLWLTPEALEDHRERQCLKDMIEPVYVARMVLFLAADDSAMCTAQNFNVEGGII